MASSHLAEDMIAESNESNWADVAVGLGGLLAIFEQQVGKADLIARAVEEYFAVLIHECHQGIFVLAYFEALGHGD